MPCLAKHAMARLPSYMHMSHVHVHVHVSAVPHRQTAAFPHGFGTAADGGPGRTDRVRASVMHDTLALSAITRGDTPITLAAMSGQKTCGTFRQPRRGLLRARAVRTRHSTGEVNYWTPVWSLCSRASRRHRGRTIKWASDLPARTFTLHRSRMAHGRGRAQS